LKVIETAPAPRTTVQSPLAWSASPDWKLDYCNIARLSAEEIRQRRAEFDSQKDVAKTVRAEAGVPSSPDARSRL
jgi:D-proline reductase (dithiol) PrdB